MYTTTYIYIYIYIYVCVYHNFFIHSSVDGHLGRFHVWLLTIVLLWAIGYIYIFKLEFSSFLDIVLGLGFLDHMATVFLVC